MSTAPATAATTSFHVCTGFTPMSCRRTHRGMTMFRSGETLPVIDERDGSFVVSHGGQQVVVRDDEMYENCRARPNEDTAAATRGLVILPEGLTITPEHQLELLEAHQGRRVDCGE